jgi:ubiquinone/menaquinone biosynthesis C-methylase UbiE
MSRRSIDAYDLPERVAAYDAGMDLMHPNRSKMVDIALEALPFEPQAVLKALDLGVGTGYFAGRFLDAYPESRVWALDGAASMIELAKARLGDRGAKVDFRVGDVRDLRQRFPDVDGLDVVYSSYVLHHLTPEEKTSVVREVVSLLRPGGWFVNADIIVAGAASMEERIQELRVRGIVERAGGADPRFADYESTRRYLDELEAAEGDRPLTLAEDLEALREAGLKDVAALWLQYREAVIVGWR